MTFQSDLRGSMAQWVAHLTRYVEVVGLSPIKGGPIKALNSEGFLVEALSMKPKS